MADTNMLREDAKSLQNLSAVYNAIEVAGELRNGVKGERSFSRRTQTGWKSFRSAGHY